MCKRVTTWTHAAVLKRVCIMQSYEDEATTCAVLSCSPSHLLVGTSCPLEKGRNGEVRLFSTYFNQGGLCVRLFEGSLCCRFYMNKEATP
jgi:hypothetical protein